MEMDISCLLAVPFAFLGFRIFQGSFYYSMEMDISSFLGSLFALNLKVASCSPLYSPEG